MALPNPLQNAISDALSEVERNPEHDLSRQYRQAIYQALGEGVDLSGGILKQLFDTQELILSEGYRRYAKLSILTARYVLPIWEQYVSQHNAFHKRIISEASRDLPRRMLEMAEQVLSGKMDALEATDYLCEDFYYGILVMCDVQYPAACAVKSAYDALEVTVGGDGEVATGAVRAFATIDEMAPGDWYRSHYGMYDPRMPVRHNFQRRLEFWRWWLMEAVPAAFQFEKS